MSNYQPFLISEFKTGLYDYLQPWIRPQDAFEPLEDAYIYRSVLQKRNGSTILGNQLADHKPVMGIMQFQNETNGSIKLVVASTKSAYVYTPGATQDSGTFDPLVTVGGANSIFWKGNATGTIPIDTFWTNWAVGPGTVFITDGTTTVSFDGAGVMTGAAGIFNSGSINYTTGIVTITFNGATANTNLSVSGTLVTPTPVLGGYFSGTIVNFFNWTNWQPTSSVTSLSVSYLYMTNNKDPVTIFDGTNLARPVFYVNSASTVFIKTALDVKTYNNRLLLLRPTILGESNAANQDIYYSAIFDPFNFVGDIAGNGGAISAATGDQIISAEFVRDNLIIAFSNSTWSFQISGVNNPPFIFRRLNSSKNTSCPYAGVQYDERVTNLGSTGFLACDGVNVQRFDIAVIDYYESRIAQKYFNQDFSQRYDNLNQTWMLYPSFDDPNPLVDALAPGSDEMLIYNFLENTWATYRNSFPMTCLGKFQITSGTTWADLNIDPNDLWENTQMPWDSYATQTTAPILIGGDTTGNLYHLDNPFAVRDGEGVSASELIALGDGGAVYSGTAKYFPIVPGTFTATDSIETFTDNGDGTLTGSAGGTGTINYTTGAWTLTFNANVTLNTSIRATYTSEGVSFNVNITTTRWNPFMSLGQKTQFGYIDVYYSVASVNPADPIQVTFNFYTDNSDKVAAQRTLTFDGPPNNDYAFKRVYCNLMGEFIRINIDPSEDAPFQILGFVLWARRAGRLTP